MFSSKVQTAIINTLLSGQTCCCFFTFFVLCVSDLQVAVPGSELLPAHDLPLQIPQRDVRAVKHHRVVAEFGGEFVVNMSHAEMDPKTVRKPTADSFPCGDRTPVSRYKVKLAGVSCVERHWSAATKLINNWPLKWRSRDDMSRCLVEQQHGLKLKRSQSVSGPM